MPLRNVAIAAMEIASVERMFPGRLIPGVGHGVLSWMGQVGARVASPLTLMREYVPALRALLAGESVTTTGRYVTLDDGEAGLAAGGRARRARGGGGTEDARADRRGRRWHRAHRRNHDAQVAAARELHRAGQGRGAARPGDHEVVVYVAVAFGADAAARAAAQLEDWGLPGETDRILVGDAAAGRRGRRGVLRRRSGCRHPAAAARRRRPRPSSSAGVAEVARLTS